MSKFFKILMYVGLALSLANCKVKYSADGVIEVEDEEGTGSIYTGDLQKLYHFRGGWFGPYPNFAHRLTLKLDAKGKINANLIVPDCEMNATVSVSTYAKLEKLILSARTKVQKDIDVADLGDNLVTLTYPEGEQDYFLSIGDRTTNKPVIIEEDSKRIQEYLEELVREIKAKKSAGCNVGRKSLEFVKYSSRQFANSTSRTNILETDVTMKKINGEYYITGSESIVNEQSSGRKTTLCFRKFSNVKVSQELVDRAHEIKIQYNQATCSILAVYPESSFNNKYTLGHANGHQESGASGCWNSPMALNAEKFTALLKEVISKQPMACY